MDLSTTYMGLRLKSPVIVGSSGLTAKINTNLALEENGAGAIVLKSLFEEQILHDVDEQRLNNMYESFTEQENYARYFTMKHNLQEYTDMIRINKEKLSIPVIASINCFSSDEWTSYAKMIEDAGADALEVNLFMLPADIEYRGEERESNYFKIIEKVGEELSIPFAVKISYYFSGLANFVYRVSQTKAAAVVLFNKFYNPDVDIEKEKVVPGEVFSVPELNTMTLRWIGILYKRVNIDLAASRGIFDGEAVVKNLLVGAKVTQVVSAVYKEGPGLIRTMNDFLSDWMERHNYISVDEFRGKASQDTGKNPVLFERSQFMQYFSDSQY